MTGEGKKARIEEIISILQQRNGASVKQLAEELNVTEMTIRRDMKILQANDIINIFHGSIVLNPNKVVENGKLSYDIFFRSGVMEREKDLIGNEAAKFIEEGDSIFVDIGTTSEALIRHIPAGMDITVISFSINVLEELKRKKINKLIFGGGYYHPDTQAFECDDMRRFISGIRASKAFISPAGISMNMGLTCVKQYEEQIKKTMVANAGKRIILADSTKFDVVRPSYICGFSEVDTLITDKLSPEWEAFLHKEDVDCVIAR